MVAKRLFHEAYGQTQPNLRPPLVFESLTNQLNRRSKSLGQVMPLPLALKMRITDWQLNGTHAASCANLTASSSPSPSPPFYIS